MIRSLPLWAALTLHFITSVIVVPSLTPVWYLIPAFNVEGFTQINGVFFTLTASTFGVFLTAIHAAMGYNSLLQASLKECDERKHKQLQEAVRQEVMSSTWRFFKIFAALNLAEAVLGGYLMGPISNDAPAMLLYILGFTLGHLAGVTTSFVLMLREWSGPALAEKLLEKQGGAPEEKPAT